MSGYVFEKLSIKINGVEKFYNVPKVNECPHCHKGIAPYVLSITETDLETRTFAIMAQCPRCSRYFAMAYKLPFGTKVAEPIEYVYTNKKINNELPIELNNISKRFIEMYNQSLIAEQNNLDKIAGMGFKKSIDFLIKDYLINFRKKEENKILSLSLEDEIEEIEDSKIKNLVLSYKWLNYCDFCNSDFDKEDIEEMKKFINIFSKFFIYNASIEK